MSVHMLVHIVDARVSKNLSALLGGTVHTYCNHLRAIFRAAIQQSTRFKLTVRRARRAIPLR